jgi:hypothetical protein
VSVLRERVRGEIESRMDMMSLAATREAERRDQEQLESMLGPPREL